MSWVGPSTLDSARFAIGGEVEPARAVSERDPGMDILSKEMRRADERCLVPGPWMPEFGRPHETERQCGAADGLAPAHRLHCPSCGYNQARTWVTPQGGAICRARPTGNCAASSEAADFESVEWPLTV
jgi:hypothetical protein